MGVISVSGMKKEEHVMDGVLNVDECVQTVNNEIYGDSDAEPPSID